MCKWLSNGKTEERKIKASEASQIRNQKIRLKIKKKTLDLYRFAISIQQHRPNTQLS